MLGWFEARAAAYAAGRAALDVRVGGAVRAGAAAVRVSLADADGHVLAEPLVTLTDLPAFKTSSVDGWAGRGAQPWQIVGQVLAGDHAKPLRESGAGAGTGAGETSEGGICVEIATGAMVPAGTEAIVRRENASRTGGGGSTDGWITGEPRLNRDWRDAGEEAIRGEVLLPAGTRVSPAVVGLAASCGYESLLVRTRPRAAVLIFGDELLDRGLPGGGAVRDALGPQLPGWLRRYGCAVLPSGPPGKDTLEAHVSAIQHAAKGADLVCTTGGTMHGPVDHVHAALASLGASYVVNTVQVRPGFPMLLAKLPDGTFVAGLPGNPQSAIVALVSLVVPLIAGLTGAPRLSPTVPLGADIPGRGDYTHLALVRLDEDGLAYPLPHAGSAMLRGLARAVGFAVIPPGGVGVAGTRVELVPLPVLPG